MKRELGILLVLLVTVGLQSRLQAQSPLGTIVGSVKDQSGAAVPNASVSLKNTERGYARSTTSDTNGEYRLPDLLPGTYDLKVQMQGFKTYEQTGVALLTYQTLRLDVSLQVGPTTQLITVTGQAPVVNTDTAASSEVLPKEALEKYITPLPMMFSIAYFDNYYSFHSLTVSGFTPNDLGAPQPKFTSDGMVVDGYDNMPPADAVREVKILDVNAPAEFSSNATTSVTTKGGDNHLHASAEARLNHPQLNARGPISAPPTYPSTGSYQADFSGGGPVFIPHVYDGRNRTFFFLAIDKTKDATTNTSQLLNIPTAQMQQGNFSQYSNKIGGAVVPIYDPTIPGQPQISCMGALNVICPNRINSVATNYMNPTNGFLPGTPPGTPNHNLSTSPNVPIQNFQLPLFPYLTIYTNLRFGRFDQKVSEKDTVNGAWQRWSQFYYPFDVVALAGGPAHRFIADIANNDDAATLTWTHVFSPHMVNEFHLGYSRSYQPSTTNANGQAVLQELGIQGINPGYNYQGIPLFSFSGLSGLTTSYEQGLQLENRFNYFDNVTISRGRHLLKFGANLLKGQFDQTGVLGSNPIFGSYSFTGRFTQNKAGAGGSSWADFLLGFPDTVQRYTPRVNIADRAYNLGIYGQDNWKVSPRLTLDFGLRWETDSVPYDANGYYFGFDTKTGAIVLPDQKALSGVSPLFNKLIPLELASAANFPSHLIAQNFKDFLPRVGIAFRPFDTNRTVFRAGYGMYHVGLLGMANVFWARNRVQNGGPFALTESFINTETANGPTLSMPAPFPATPGSAASTYSISATAPNLHSGYTQQWNATAEQEIWHTALSFSYIGSETIRLPWSRNILLVPPSTTPFNSSGCSTPGPRPNPTCRYEYYGFTGITYTDNGGLSSYNSMMLEFTHPFAKGLYMHGGYIWNRQINETDGTNPYDRRYGRSEATGLPLQRVVVDWLYNLPVGKGQSFLNSPTSSRLANDVIDDVIGGWSTSAFWAFYTGDNFTVTYTGTDPAGVGIFSGRPDRIGSGQLANPSYNNGFDQTAFHIPASDIGRFGNETLYALRAVHTQRFLLSVYKDFRLTEKLKFRLDCAFNDPFNQHQFGPPAAVLGVNGVGIQASSTALGESARSIALDGRLFF